jgi:hypothetical protein
MDVQPLAAGLAAPHRQPGRQYFLVFEAKPARKRPVRNMPQNASMADNSWRGEEVWEISP